MKKKILCYGDSNTWGYIPGGKGRYPEDVRWPKVLQTLLGDEYEIIENGINGRTTCQDKGWGECKNGKTGIGYALLANYPLDGVIIMLGTNDLVEHNAVYAKNGVAEVIRMVQGANYIYGADHPIFESDPKILLVSPILIHKDINSKDTYSFLNTYEESLKFSKYFKMIAEEKHVEFLDASKYAEPSDVDGLHMEKQGHIALANAIANKTKEMYE